MRELGSYHNLNWKKYEMSISSTYVLVFKKLNRITCAKLPLQYNVLVDLTNGLQATLVPYFKDRLYSNNFGPINPHIGDPELLQAFHRS